jgi:hypothetical protein
VPNTGQRRGETVSQSSDWSARWLRRCRYWIAPASWDRSPRRLTPARGACFPVRHPPRLRGPGAMCNALPCLAHGRSRRCHPGPPCRRLRAAAPTAASGRVVRWSGPYGPLHRRPWLRHRSHRRGHASAASRPRKAHARVVTKVWLSAQRSADRSVQPCSHGHCAAGLPPPCAGLPGDVLAPHRLGNALDQALRLASPHRSPRGTAVSTGSAALCPYHDFLLPPSPS